MLNHNPMSKCCEGQRYAAEAPDTLDLVDRMALAINALTNVWAPDDRWALGFRVDFSHRPAVLWTTQIADAHLEMVPEFLEALLLCRAASGSTQNLDVDGEVLRTQLEFLGDDGLTYCPTDTRREIWKAQGIDQPYPYATDWSEGRRLSTLSMLAQVDDDPRWVEIGKRKVGRMLELTREKDGFRFLWKRILRQGETVPPGADEPGLMAAEKTAPVKRRRSSSMDNAYLDFAPLISMTLSIGGLGHGAASFHRVTGYEPALELSGGMAQWALARMFNNADGRYNFYNATLGLFALIAVCDYGCAAGDREVLERVDACYRWARAMGDPLIGYYTTGMPGWRGHGGVEPNVVELCVVADMVVLALRLTRAGLGDYWDDVDRWVRNVYAEAQMLDAGFVDRIPEDYLSDKPSERAHQDTRDVAERSVGAFFGYMLANDGLYVMKTDAGPKLYERSIMHCCTANGARTLYYVWDSIITREAGEVRVNLLLNRASEWLDVDSYLPAEGKVVLHIKAAEKVAVRMPEWCDPAGVQVSVGDESRWAVQPPVANGGACGARAVAEGRFLKMAWLRPGDRVTLTFPVPERVVHRAIGEAPFKLVLRGSNVVSIDPKGTACPLYESTPTGELVTKTRFIPAVGGLTW
ncbi:MAG: glycoside hydrolase family 127 protein [Candidatus Brocadiia bacterium]|nr:glycoside hydrolase family 127 protein [Candidatus Brocadiia bacterium]